MQNPKYIFLLLPVVLFIHLDRFGVIDLVVAFFRKSNGTRRYSACGAQSAPKKKETHLKNVQRS